MKAHVLLLIFTFVFSSSVFARPLKDVMSDMGGKFRLISRPINAGSAGATEIQHVKALIDLVTEASAVLPDVVRNSSSPQREELEILYNNLMHELITEFNTLLDAITAGDSSLAKTSLQRILQLRTEGHDQFKI